MKLTHLGHACVLVETDSARLLLDPGTMSAFEAVRDLDAVLVTHQHADHVDPARLGTLLEENPAAALVIDVDSVEVLSPWADRAQVARPGDSLTFGSTTVDVTGGRHDDIYAGIPGCTNSAYSVDHGAFFHPGDSFFVPGFDVDVLALPIDGPWLKLAEAINYAKAVRPRLVVPIHEGETTDAGKYIGMITHIGSLDNVRALEAGQATEL